MEQERLFLFFARNGQSIADTTFLEELDASAIGELQKFFHCKLMSRNTCLEYFLQGYVPEIRKQFEKLHPLEKWNDILQKQCIDVGKTQFDVFYRETIEVLLK